MKRKGFIMLCLAMLLLTGNVLVISAQEQYEAVPASDAGEWNVYASPGIPGSATAYVLKGTAKLFGIHISYYYSSSDSNGIQVTSPGSNDTVYITSTDLRTMYYNSTVKYGDSVQVDFYAYSSTARIVGNGFIY